MFGHLLKGCCGKLEHVDLPNNVFTHKRTKEGLVPLWKHYFTSTTCLKRINLSGCRLPADAVKYVTHYQLGPFTRTVFLSVTVTVKFSLTDRMGSKPNLSVKWSVTIGTINFDGDFDGHGDGQSRCNQARRPTFEVGNEEKL